jgi:hypothetical protein
VPHNALKLQVVLLPGSQLCWRRCYFTYREHGTPALGAWRVSSPNRLLAYWNTAGLTGTWTIHVQARVAGTVVPIYAADVTFCVADGTSRQTVDVTLDQQKPVGRSTSPG